MSVKSAWSAVSWSLVALLGGAVSEGRAAERSAAGLAAAERAFAADAQAIGVRDAFVRHLAADAWLLRPQPVRAKAWFDAHPARPGKLMWGPEYAEIAASGDFGYTYGPWNSEAPDGAKGAGHFFSVWKRGDDGVWKNVVDHGIGHGPVALDASLTLRTPGLGVPDRADTAALDARRNELQAVDDALNGAATESAVASRVADDARVFADGKPPQAAVAPVAATIAPAGLRRVGGDVAASGDLAYTVGGRADARADAPGGYVRMWRRDAQRGWLVVVSLATAPIEPPSREAQ